MGFESKDQIANNLTENEQAIIKITERFVKESLFFLELKIEKEIKELNDKIFELQGADRAVNNELSQLQSENERLKKELQGYGNFPDGTYHGPDDIYEDIGKPARELLRELGVK